MDSDFIRVRELRYHVRRWGDPAAPQVFLLHGFLDVSATWQPVAEGLLPALEIIPIQLLMVPMAIARGFEPAKFLNGAKVTAIE